MGSVSGTNRMIKPRVAVTIDPSIRDIGTLSRLYYRTVAGRLFPSSLRPCSSQLIDIMNDRNGSRSYKYSLKITFDEVQANAYVGRDRVYNLPGSILSFMDEVKMAGVKELEIMPGTTKKELKSSLRAILSRETDGLSEWMGKRNNIMSVVGQEGQ